MQDANIQTQLDADGVLLATIDMPGRAMNVFSAAMMDSLEALLNHVDADGAVRAVVLTSGKPAFLAGADLEMIRMFTERARSGGTAELHELFGRLGRLFRRLELSRKPYVAAVNGLALGGGLEVALACHARVAADDAKTVQLGLPEIKLGLLPGAGGTQRLPRLIGAAKGLEMLLTGEPVTPQQGLALGLVDEVVPADLLINAAKRRARELEAAQARWDRAGFVADAGAFDFSDAVRAEMAIADAVGISTHQLRYYPAYHAIIDCVVGGWKLGMTAACTREMDIFVELMRDPVAGNMVRSLFLERGRAAKAGLLKPGNALDSGEHSLIASARAARENAERLQLGEEEQVLAVALAVLRRWSPSLAVPPELVDAAIVAAGLMPAYSGGAFSYLRQHGVVTTQLRAAEAARRAPLFELPNDLAALAA